MITSETPYKLIEIIHDTWPQLSKPTKPLYNSKNSKEKNERNSESN